MLGAEPALLMATRARLRAVAAPMPFSRPEPVTMATLPVRERVTGAFGVVGGVFGVFGVWKLCAWAGVVREMDGTWKLVEAADAARERAVEDVVIELYIHELPAPGDFSRQADMETLGGNGTPRYLVPCRRGIGALRDAEGASDGWAGTARGRRLEVAAPRPVLRRLEVATPHPALRLEVATPRPALCRHLDPRLAQTGVLSGSPPAALAALDAPGWPCTGGPAEQQRPGTRR